MARPLKKGLDYFPLQTDIFTTGSELAPLLNRYDGLGLLVYLHILCDIYQNGYYLKVPFMDDYKASIRKSINCSDDVVNGSISLLERLKILTFIEEKEYVVITSKGIQKRYLEVVKDRKRSLENLLKKFKNEYWLLSDEEVQEKCSKLTENVNFDVKRGKTPVKREFSGEKPQLNGDKAGIKCTNKGLLSLTIVSEESIDECNEDNDNNQDMILSNLAGVRDEFEEGIEREKREKELREKLGLNEGKLERKKGVRSCVSGVGEEAKSFDVEAYGRFVDKWHLEIKSVGNYCGTIYEVDWDKLSERFENSGWLKNTKSMEFVLKNYEKIMSGYYDDFKREPKGGEVFKSLAEKFAKEEDEGNDEE